MHFAAERLRSYSRRAGLRKEMRTVSASRFSHRALGDTSIGNRLLWEIKQHIVRHYALGLYIRFLCLSSIFLTMGLRTKEKEDAELWWSTVMKVAENQTINALTKE